MPRLAHSPDRNRFLLTYVSFDGVEFALLDESSEFLRPVRVNVGSGTSWLRTARFPDMESEATASTGDAQLDQEIRELAAEELVRFAAAAETPRAA